MLCIDVLYNIISSTIRDTNVNSTGMASCIDCRLHSTVIAMFVIKKRKNKVPLQLDPMPGYLADQFLSKLQSLSALLTLNGHIITTKALVVELLESILFADYAITTSSDVSAYTVHLAHAQNALSTLMSVHK